MRSRRWHILVVLFVLAMCRILHDSLPALAPAAEQAQIQTSVTTAIRGASLSTTPPAFPPDGLEWLSLAPATIDAPPGAPATQPSEPVVQWVMTPVILPRLLPRTMEPKPVHPPSAPPALIDAVVMDSPSIPYIDFLSTGSTETQVSDEQEIPRSPTSSRDRPLTAAPPASVVQTPVPADVASIPAPLPEPAASPCVLLLAMLLRASQHRRRALSSRRYVSPSSVPG